MKEIETRFRTMKKRYLLPIALGVIGGLTTGAGIGSNSTTVIIIGALLMGLGSYLFRITQERNTKINHLLANYESKTENAISILDSLIDDLENQNKKSNSKSNIRNITTHGKLVTLSKRKAMELEEFIKIKDLVTINYLNK